MFSANMSGDFGTWVKNGTITINNGEFVIGETEYTMTISVSLTQGENSFNQSIVYKIRTNNNGIPSVNIQGTGGDYDTLYNETYRVNAYMGMVFSSNSVVNSYNSTGDTILANVTAGGCWGQSTTVSDNEFINIVIDADFPIFSLGSTHVVYDVLTWVQLKPTVVDYLAEIASGDYTHIDSAINYGDISDSIPENTTYFINSSLKVNGHMTTQKGYCFQILPDAKICLYQDDNVTGDASPNLHLIISEFPCRVKEYGDPDTDYVESSSVDTNYWHSGYWRDLNTGVNYTGICSTNIPIYRGLENAQKYLNGELSESDAINGGIFSKQNSTIGDELTGSDIPTVNLAMSGVGCFAYAVSESQIKDIMENYLFTNNTTLQDTLKEALWQWGNNPIDFMIDCYYIPFAVTHFYDTINTNLKFGTYQFPNTSFPAIQETNGDRLVLFNTTFEGVYSDWRDFTQFSYDLFLPFIGFVPLDVQKYLNKQVRCEMMFDITTHNLRYYLFVNNIITDRFDGSVGVNIPLMATDIVNKAKHDREIKYGLVSDALNLSGSIGRVAGGDLGGVVSGVNSIIGGIKKYGDLSVNPSSGVEGSFSSSMNIYDISYAYLRITERQTIIPDNTNQIYNYPSYYMGTLSNLSGYCEIDDIQLKSNCTEYEYNEIKNILKEGVIF